VARVSEPFTVDEHVAVVNVRAGERIVDSREQPDQDRLSLRRAPAPSTPVVSACCVAQAGTPAHLHVTGRVGNVMVGDAAPRLAPADGPLIRK
jgi:hypothetical protein